MTDEDVFVLWFLVAELDLFVLLILSFLLPLEVARWLRRE